VDVFLEAMRQVPATALIVGDGPLRSTLEAAAARLGLSTRVRFLGHVEDEEVVAHMHACDLFVLPSVTRAETFGVVQLEAMACGKPVVSTNVPTGVPWVNRHDETGLVVEPGDAAALAGALNSLVGDAALRTRLGTRARQRVEETFTVERMTSKSTALYREVVVGPQERRLPAEAGSHTVPAEAGNYAVPAKSGNYASSRSALRRAGPV
jgi:rhamnosyl/mannosyltransferase